MDSAQEVRCYDANVSMGANWNHNLAAEKLKDELMLDGAVTQQNEKWPDDIRRWIVKED